MPVHSTKYSVQSSGQALVIVLLSLAVVLTLVLYILSRSITDIAISSREEEAVRAFSAAEAGIERALIIGSGGSGSFGDAGFTSAVSSFAEGLGVFNFPISLASGDSTTLWFVGHNDNGDLDCTTEPCFNGNSLTVCWGTPGTPSDVSTAPAVEVSLFYEAASRLDGDFSDVRIARSALDPHTSRLVTNSFSQATTSECDLDGTKYQFQKTINIGADFTPAVNTNGLLFARLRMFYNTGQNHPVGFSVAGDTLPSQGILIDSIGSSGEANRRLAVFQGYPEVPLVFDSVVFSSGGLVHQ